MVLQTILSEAPRSKGRGLRGAFRSRLKRRQANRLHNGKLFEGLSDRFDEQF